MRQLTLRNWAISSQLPISTRPNCCRSTWLKIVIFEDDAARVSPSVALWAVGAHFESPSKGQKCQIENNFQSLFPFLCQARSILDDEIKSVTVSVAFPCRWVIYNESVITFRPSEVHFGRCSTYEWIECRTNKQNDGAHFRLPFAYRPELCRQCGAFHFWFYF